MEQLWERSEEGRKETNRKPSTRTWKEGMRDQAGKNGGSQEAKAEGCTGEATVRRSREVRKGRNRGLSSRRRNGSGRKEAEGKRKIPRAKAKGKHLRNSCGKRIREGRKETNREPSTRTWKEGTRDQAGEKGESEEAKAEARTGEATVRRSREEWKGRTEG